MKVADYKWRSVGIGGALVATLLEPAAYAVDSADAQLQEVVVTATRRDQSILDVPISITALTQEQMDARGVKSFEDVVRLTPGLALSRNARSDRQGEVLSIRGISSSAGSATVGVYIDDTPVQVRPVATNSNNPYPRVFDLDRVEVLRGPQGTLFGVGSEGGTVRFISPRPSLTDSSFYSRSELFNTDAGGLGAELGFAGGTPIINNTLGFRASFWTRHEPGYVDRVDVHNTRVVDSSANWNEAVSARVALAWKPLDSVTVAPSVFYQKTKVGDSSQFFQNYSDTGNTELRNGSPLAQPSSNHFTLPTLKVDVELGNLLLVSNTSYLDRKVSSVLDSTFLDEATLGGFNTLPPPAPLDQATSTGAINEHDRSFTQEIRLQGIGAGNRLHWVVGALYQKTTQTQSYNVIDPYIDALIQANPAFGFLGPNRTAAQLFGVPLYQNTYLLFTNSRVHDEQKAGFGQVDFKILDRLTLIAGVRVADTKYSSVGFSAGPVLRTNGRITTLDQQADPVTPKWNVAYEVSDNSRVYAGAAKGFRIGSATAALPASCLGDATAIGLPLGAREVQPDSVWSYEVGSKNRLRDGRMDLSGSVFYVNWRNIQSAITLANCNVPTTANLGAARSRGFDLQLDAVLWSEFTASVGVGYTDVKTTETTYGAVNPATGLRGIIRSKGQPVGDTPPWTASLSAEQRFSAFRHDAYARFDYQYQSQDHTPPDLAAGADRTIARGQSLSNLDLRLGVKVNGFDVSAFVANATNDLPLYGTFRETLATSIYHSTTVRPRTYGVTTTYRF
jgi:outer membrane receptor protein involved in Fe transport